MEKHTLIFRADLMKRGSGGLIQGLRKKGRGKGANQGQGIWKKGFRPIGILQAGNREEGELGRE
jgi:hypothetical protein